MNYTRMEYFRGLTSAGVDRRKLRLDDQLCFALYAATNAVTRVYRPLLAELDLTYTQYLVLMALWEDGSATIRQIADRLQLGPNAMTPLVDRLATAGLITRHRDTVDRRVIFVELTEAGKKLEGSAAVVQQEVVCRTGLSDGDLALLRENLHQLVNRISADGHAIEEIVSRD